ncbi:MAG: isochorismate synthase [Candidatus Neomarinimicrobiota bacterium]
MSSGQKLDAATLNSDRYGFVFHPFFSNTQNPEYFYPINWLLDAETAALKVIGNDVTAEYTKKINAAVQHENTNYERHTIQSKNYSDRQNLGGEKKEFLKLAANAISEIDAGKIRKVVLARTKRMDLTDGTEVAKIFEDLCRFYPEAFVSMVSRPGAEIWIGATPEPFLQSISAEYSAIALAGTRVKSTIHKDNEWNNKEKIEQELVAKFFEESLTEFDIKGLEIKGPNTIPAGHLEHIQTEFRFRIGERPDSTFMELIQKLHPSPAICGYPKETAMNFISEYESFDRSFFCGFLGPVNSEKKSSLFVNIRCAQVFGDAVIIYAGAGITIDSDPVKEWEETNLKCDTIIKALNF